MVISLNGHLTYTPFNDLTEQTLQNNGEANTESWFNFHFI